MTDAIARATLDYGRKTIPADPRNDPQNIAILIEAHGPGTVWTLPDGTRRAIPWPGEELPPGVLPW